MFCAPGRARAVNAPMGGGCGPIGRLPAVPGPASSARMTLSCTSRSRAPLQSTRSPAAPSCLPGRAEAATDMPTHGSAGARAMLPRPGRPERPPCAPDAWARRNAPALPPNAAPGLGQWAGWALAPAWPPRRARVADAPLHSAAGSAAGVAAAAAARSWWDPARGVGTRGSGACSGSPGSVARARAGAAAFCSHAGGRAVRLSTGARSGSGRPRSSQCALTCPHPPCAQRPGQSSQPASAGVTRSRPTADRQASAMRGSHRAVLRRRDARSWGGRGAASSPWRSTRSHPARVWQRAHHTVTVGTSARARLAPAARPDEAPLRRARACFHERSILAPPGGK